MSPLCSLIPALLLICSSSAVHWDIPEFDISSSSPSFTDGTKYYRYLMLDEQTDALYVGSMEHVYRLNADNIADTSVTGVFRKSADLPARDNDITYCNFRHSQSEFHCKNHIRLLVVLDGGVYGCGTGSYYPLEFTLRKSDLSPVEPYPPTTRSTGMKRCPHSPDGSYATLYVDEGSPRGVASVYAATVTPISSTQQLWYRPELRYQGAKVSDALQTVDTNVNMQNKWLSDPTFVGTFETSSHVYLFFNEIAMEYHMSSMVPRVARICKNDRGGPRYSLLEELWTSFIKVRLNCSLAGDNPFYFNQLRDIRKVGSTYYGLFSTPENTMTASAICHFTQADIDTALDSGKFIEYDNDNGWQEVDDGRVPTQRPGTCNDDSLGLGATTLNFIYSHPLIHDALSPSTQHPIYHTQESALKLLVDTTQAKDGVSYTVFYVVTGSGQLRKVVYDAYTDQAELVAKWKPFSADTTVQYALSHGENIYLSTDAEIRQLSVEQCSLYVMCTDCVQDPHCGWNQLSRSCARYNTQTFQSVMGDGLHECSGAGACYNTEPDQAEDHQLTLKVPGDAVHMACESVCTPNEGKQKIWYVDDRPVPVGISPLKYVLTMDGGLVILNATRADDGTYECKTSGVLLAEYQVTVPDCSFGDEDCIWKTEFRNWCAAFDEYRSQYNNWLCMKNECFHNDNCEAPDAAAQCSAGGT